MTSLLDTTLLGETLLDITAELVAIPSVSHNEQEICAYVEAELRKLPWLEVERIGDNVVARTDLGRSSRLILGGHLDTVPPSSPDGDVGLRREGDILWGTGSSDMKGALAVYLMLAREIPEPSIDVTYVFYAREEVARKYSGLLELQAARPDLLECDAAILGEPTDGVIEAGCQGGLRASVKVAGKRAHAARAWMGENAVHGLAPLLSALRTYQPRKPVIDGCEFHESMQAMSATGGIAGNVVPDEAEVVISHRFAPDRTTAQAEQHVKDFVAGAFAAKGYVAEAEGSAANSGAESATAEEGSKSAAQDRDSMSSASDKGSKPAARNDGSSSTPEFKIEILDTAPACPPGLNHPLLQSLVEAVTKSGKVATSESESSGAEGKADQAPPEDRPAGIATQITPTTPVRAKLGWTDVAFFGEQNIPAANFGPGNPLLAHAPNEQISTPSLHHNYETLAAVLGNN